MKIDFSQRNFKWLTQTTVSNPAGEVWTFYPSTELHAKHSLDPSSSEAELYRGYTLNDGNTLKTEREIKNWMAGGEDAVAHCVTKVSEVIRDATGALSAETVRSKLGSLGIHAQTIEVAMERLIADRFLTQDDTALLTKNGAW